MSSPVLRPGERILIERAANLVVHSADYGLRPITGAWMRRPLMRGFGDESLGGRLYLTNQRIHYDTHPVNRVTVTFDIPLRSLTSFTDVSWGVARMVQLHWDDQSCVFVVWGIRRLLDTIESARNSPESLVDPAPRGGWDALPEPPRPPWNPAD